MKTIEKHIKDIFTEIKKELPELHHISFNVAYYPDSGSTRTYGFIHIGDECEEFSSVIEVLALIKRSNLLFRKF